jgi:hypothetical protein
VNSNCLYSGFSLDILLRIADSIRTLCCVVLVKKEKVSDLSINSGSSTVGVGSVGTGLESRVNRLHHLQFLSVMLGSAVFFAHEIGCV